MKYVKKKALFLLLLAWIMVCALPVSADTNGWVQNGQSWYYYENNSPYVSRWLLYKGSWYYFDSDATMMSNEFFIAGGKIYYARDWGGIYQNNNNVWINGSRFAFDASGAVTNWGSGWHQPAGWYHYRQDNGRDIVSNWLLYKNCWYYFDANGDMEAGEFFNVGGKTYYARDWGGIYQNTSAVINGNTYYFDASGALYTPSTTGWETYGDTYRYKEANGQYAVSKWILYKNNWYYFESNGLMMRNRFFDVGGKTYYARDWGGIYMNTSAVINGVTYYFDASGARYTPNTGWESYGDTYRYKEANGQYAVSKWLLYKDNWYYLESNGLMMRNRFFDVGGKTYYARDWGGIYTGTRFTVNGYTYQAASGGDLYKGWIDYGNGSYSFANLNSGALYYNAFVNWKGEIYYLGGDGLMKTGWQQIGGSWYYFRDWGGAYRNCTVAINGKNYTFNGNGVMTAENVINQAPSNPTPSVPVSSEQSLTNFLKRALLPVGQTLYVYGGGHSGSDLGIVGLNPEWKRFFDSQNSSYIPEQHEFEAHKGLDCSGYVSWAIRQTLGRTIDTESIHFPKTLSDMRWGSYSENYSGPFYPGDIVAIDSRHCWIVIGTCSDGSVVLLHATSTGRCVQISGTTTPGGSLDSRAIKVANLYMSTYYREAMGRYGVAAGDPSFLKNVRCFHWSSGIFGDVDYMRTLNAEQVLTRLYSN